VDELRADGWGASDLEALQEFVADDGTDWPDGLADPVFKERLRMDAWWMIVSRRRTPTYGTLQR
jgi:hypothetical protein